MSYCAQKSDDLSAFRADGPSPELMYNQVDILSDGWLADQLQLASWVVGHLTKCYLCIDVKDGHPLKIKIRFRLTFASDWMAGQLQLAGCLAD